MLLLNKCIAGTVNKKGEQNKPQSLCDVINGIVEDKKTGKVKLPNESYTY